MNHVIHRNGCNSAFRIHLCADFEPQIIFLKPHRCCQMMLVYIFVCRLDLSVPIHADRQENISLADSTVMNIQTLQILAAETAVIFSHTVVCDDHDVALADSPFIVGKRRVKHNTRESLCFIVTNLNPFLTIHVNDSVIDLVHHSADQTNVSDDLLLFHMLSVP